MGPRRFLILLTLSPATLWAADSPLFAAPAATAAAPVAGGAARVVVSLIVVLAAVFAAAWFARRMRSLKLGGNGGIEIVAQVTLGARERAVLLKVGAERLLVGVAPGNVRLLQALAPGEIEPVSSPSAFERPNFKALLLRSLGK